MNPRQPQIEAKTAIPETATEIETKKSTAPASVLSMFSDDDKSILDIIAKGGQLDAHSFKRYVTNSANDPLGRTPQFIAALSEKAALETLSFIYNMGLFSPYEWRQTMLTHMTEGPFKNQCCVYRIVLNDNKDLLENFLNLGGYITAKEKQFFMNTPLLGMPHCTPLSLLSEKNKATPQSDVPLSPRSQMLHKIKQLETERQKQSESNGNETLTKEKKTKKKKSSGIEEKFAGEQQTLKVTITAAIEKWERISADKKNIARATKLQRDCWSEITEKVSTLKCLTTERLIIKQKGILAHYTEKLKELNNLLTTYIEAKTELAKFYIDFRLLCQNHLNAIDTTLNNKQLKDILDQFKKDEQTIDAKLVTIDSIFSNIESMTHILINKSISKHCLKRSDETKGIQGSKFVELKSLIDELHKQQTAHNMPLTLLGFLPSENTTGAEVPEESKNFVKDQPTKTTHKLKESDLPLEAANTEEKKSHVSKTERIQNHKEAQRLAKEAQQKEKEQKKKMSKEKEAAQGKLAKDLLPLSAASPQTMSKIGIDSSSEGNISSIPKAKLNRPELKPATDQTARYIHLSLQAETLRRNALAELEASHTNALKEKNMINEQKENEDMEFTKQLNQEGISHHPQALAEAPPIAIATPIHAGLHLFSQEARIKEDQRNRPAQSNCP